MYTPNARGWWLAYKENTPLIKELVIRNCVHANGMAKRNAQSESRERKYFVSQETLGHETLKSVVTWVSAWLG